MRQDDINNFLAERKEAGRKFDPKSADVIVTYQYTQHDDPYGILGTAPPEYYCVGRSYFARSADSGWISFDDLPDESRGELWRRIEAGELVDAFEKRKAAISNEGGRA